jgi:hypothetical protein
MLITLPPGCVSMPGNLARPVVETPEGPPATPTMIV